MVPEVRSKRRIRIGINHRTNLGDRPLTNSKGNDLFHVINNITLDIITIS